MNADSNNEHKALFYERYHSEWNSKSSREYLIPEKKSAKIVKVWLNLNKMIGIKSPVRCTAERSITIS
jgi:hypothetical protein